MNKAGILALSALLSLGMISCGGQKEEAKTKEEPKKEATSNAEEVTLKVNTNESNIRWEGSTSGVQVYSHYGDLALKNGSITVKGDKITNGSFVVDMTTIQPKDDGYSEENPKEKLVGHLSTGDFFLVEEYPTASFEVTGATEGGVKGNLTIRGNTNEETIEVTEMNMENGKLTAKGKLVFDRQKYDVNWKHFMKDVILKDDIELDITLVASK